MVKLKRFLSAGYILNEYRIEKPLGGGGFSLVYLAYHITTKAKVVVKEYYPEDLCYRMPGGRIVPLAEEKLPAFALGIRRFFNEAKALAGVDHPNIVRVTNIFRTNNTVYMVMDYEQGTDLRWYIKRHAGGLKESVLRTVFPPLLLGLRELHNRGLLHLDIKPANILLRSGGRPLLLDFGAAEHYMMGSPDFSARTLTPGFAPIEQHEKHHLGPWTDIYAIGASMYSCIRGEPPPPSRERLENDRLVPLVKSHARRYSRRLLEAIDWSLQMDYRSRPQNVDELLEFCFQKEIQSAAGEQEPPSRWDLRAWWSRMHRS